MDLSIRHDRVAGQSYKWAASAHGFDATRSGTIDISTLDEETHYPDGHIESGFAVGKITASGLYGPYDDDASDGRQTCVGFVVDAHTIGEADISVSILNHGQINNDELPFPLDAAGVADLEGAFIVHGEVGS